GRRPARRSRAAKRLGSRRLGGLDRLLPVYELRELWRPGRTARQSAWLFGAQAYEPPDPTQLHPGALGAGWLHAATALASITPRAAVITSAVVWLLIAQIAGGKAVQGGVELYRGRRQCSLTLGRLGASPSHRLAPSGHSR